MSSDSFAVPDPPPPESLKLNLETWESGRAFLRCHPSRFKAGQFNPGAGSGRFHPFSTPGGQIVPTLYAADGLDGALSETIFHDIPVRGPLKAVSRRRLEDMAISILVPRRDLILAQLYGYGLLALGVSRAELIASDRRFYDRTALWAQAIHAGAPAVDGLIWVSRQHDAAQCLILFGDRVKGDDLRVVRSPLALDSGAGLDRVQDAADRAGIAILE